MLNIAYCNIQFRKKRRDLFSGAASRLGIVEQCQHVRAMKLGGWSWAIHPRKLEEEKDG